MAIKLLQAQDKTDQPPRSRMKRIAIGAGKAILATFAVAGVGVVACAAPNLFSAFGKLRSLGTGRAYSPHEKKEIRDMFGYLRRRGYVNVSRHNHQIYISLTPKGRKIAGKYHIDSLSVRPQKEWDGVWRVLLFDVPHKVRLRREALRGKLKELGFQMLQKSVWVHAFPCEQELQILRQFFNLREDQMIVLTSASLGSCDKTMRLAFHV